MGGAGVEPSNDLSMSLVDKQRETDKGPASSSSVRVPFIPCAPIDFSVERRLGTRQDKGI